MKSKLLGLLSLVIVVMDGISQCPINTITTDPDNYQNASDPSQNLKFDWRLASWNGYRPGTPSPVLYQITSPFFDNNGNPNISDLALVATKNYSPADGWEFIARNFGTTLQGTDAPWFVLYNRYNGVLRLFIQINSNFTTVQAASVILRFTQGYNTSALFSQRGNNTLALNKFTGKATSEVPNQYNNSGMGGNQYFWLYGDIPTMYDPCTCGKYSRLNLEAFLFSNWEVKLDINGTIQTTGILISNNQNSVVNNNGSGFGIDKLINGPLNYIQGVKQLFESSEKLSNEGDKFMDLFAENGKLAPPNTFLDLLGGGSSYLTGVKGFLSAAGTFIGLFEKRQGRPDNQITKTTIATNSKLKATATGSINITSLFANGYINNPGSNQSNPTLDPKLKPAYNNVLGVFNIIEKPQLEYAVYRPETECLNQQIANDPDCIYNGNCQPSIPSLATSIVQYKLNGTLKYVLNPASGLKINDIKVGLVFPMDKAHLPTQPMEPTPTVNWGNVPAFDLLDEVKLNKMGYNVILKKNPNSLDNALISTSFVPVTCIDKLSFYMSGGGLISVDSIGLRIFLELEPIAPNPGTTIDKTILIHTYYYTVSEVTGVEFGSYDDIVSWSDNNFDGQPDYNSIVSGPWTFTQGGCSGSAGAPKWPNTFAGVPTNLKLENTVISSHVVCLRDLELGNNVSFGASPITLYVLGNVINNTGSPLPSNVNIVRNVNDPCGLLVHSPASSDVFCSSSLYNTLSSPFTIEGDTTLEDYPTANMLKGLAFKLHPNPASNNVKVVFELSNKSEISIDIFQSSGVKQPASSFIANQLYQAGKYEINLSTEVLRPGVYFVRLIANNQNSVQRLVIQR